MDDYTVMQKPMLTIVGIECRTSNALDAGPVDIPKHWEKFFRDGIAEKIPNKTSDEVFALYCNYAGDHTQPYSLVIGCSVDNASKIPEGMVAKTIPSGSYACFRAVGEHPQSLIETWGKIWNTKLSRSYSGDYELYGEKFTSHSPQEVEVLIAIS